MAPDHLPQNNTLVALPIVAIENILSFMYCDEISQLHQTQNRMKLMADNYEDDHFRFSRSNQTDRKPTPDQIIQPLLELDQNRSKLKLYFGHLTALCHDRDPLILRGLALPASYNADGEQAA